MKEIGTQVWLFYGLIALSFLYVLLGIDDFFIDLVALVAKLKPRRLSQDDVLDLLEKPQKKIAIIIPAWKEGHIIRRMLVGNAKRIRYENYFFFVGIYPNDLDTRRDLDGACSDLPNVVTVVNTDPGPTSKGQMLNQVVGAVFRYAKEHNLHFDLFLMQDAEDVIHPLMLPLVNQATDEFPFVQTPVFSLSVNRGQLVASTYMDEFAECHTKDILVRQYLGAAVPSAGVGTAMSASLVKNLMGKRGFVFNEGSLTEDYELGVTVHSLGYRPQFVCAYHVNQMTKKREFIATREYFPKSLIRSIRQKTRWSLGICLQGWRNLGWLGNGFNRFFLYRDRKGILTNGLVLFGYVYFLFLSLLPEVKHEVRAHTLIQILLVLNLFLMINRCLQRMFCVQRVFGMAAALPVILSWPIASFINAAASFSAVKRDLVARLTKVSVPWAKTEHELPDFFGEEGTVPRCETAMVKQS